MKFCPTNPLFFGLSLRWKVEGKRTPLTGHALQAHVSAVGLGNLPDHRQAQTGAALLSPNGVHLVKPLPHPCLLVRGNANPVVPHGEQCLPALAAKGHPDPTPRLSIFEPIVNEILQQPGNQRPVYLGKDRLPSLQGQAILGPGALGTHLPGQGGQIHPFPPSQFRPGG